MGGSEYVEVGEDGGEVQFRAVAEQAGYVTWIPVTSTNLDAVAYEPAYRRLWVSYRDKRGPSRRYCYFGVGPDKWADLLASNSKGSWADYVLKGNTGSGVYTHPYQYAGPF